MKDRRRKQEERQGKSEPDSCRIESIFFSTDRSQVASIEGIRRTGEGVSIQDWNMMEGEEERVGETELGDTKAAAGGYVLHLYLSS